MRKMTKSQRINQIADQLARQQGVISKLTTAVKEQNEAILMLEKLTDEKLRDQPEPQLKQLDQSVFDGLDERWVAASVEENGIVRLYLSDESNPYDCEYHLAGTKYDTTDWQNSLIERDTAKELVEVDLSSELTGSDYFHSNITSALLESGSKLVVCFVSNTSELKALSNKRIEVITSLDTSFNDSDGYGWQYAIPINNQGEPLTAAEAGL